MERFESVVKIKAGNKCTFLNEIEICQIVAQGVVEIIFDDIRYNSFASGTFECSLSLGANFSQVNLKKRVKTIEVGGTGIINVIYKQL